MYDISESTKYQQYLKGERRVDGSKSAWRAETEAWIAEHKGDVPKVSSDQIKARQVRVIKDRAERRLCSQCTKVIRQESVTGLCREHQPKGEPRVPRAKTICPPCGKPIRKTEYGLCSKCQQKYKYLIHQKALITCDECPRRLHKDNASGKCKAHSRALRTNQLAA